MKKGYRGVTHGDGKAYRGVTCEDGKAYRESGGSSTYGWGVTHTNETGE
jgi:hypothetical protein